MRIADLIDIYGELLSDRRREIIEAYYFEDFSLSEISLNTGISRQGVRDSIKKSEAELREFENKLRLREKNSAFQNEKSEIADRIKAISSSLPCPQSSELSEIADRIKELSLLG